MNTPIPKWLFTTGRAITLLGIINFVVFVAVDLYLGGDALNGKAEAGHYYLSQNGRLTEVSRAVYGYSRVHGISAFATLVLAIVCGGVLSAYKSNPKSRDGHDASGRDGGEG